MTTTKDEALRVVREALTKARSCVDATASKEHAAWAAELDSALRTIALAVEGPKPVELTDEERATLARGGSVFSDCYAVQSVALGEPTSASAGKDTKHERRDVPPGKWKVDMPDGTYCQMPGDPPGPGDVRAVINGYVYWVTPRSGKLVAMDPPRALGVQGTSNGQPKEN